MQTLQLLELYCKPLCEMLTNLFIPEKKASNISSETAQRRNIIIVFIVISG